MGCSPRPAGIGTTLTTSLGARTEVFNAYNGSRVAVLPSAVSSIFSPDELCAYPPSFGSPSRTIGQYLQRALHPFWGPYVPVLLHLLVCYTPVFADHVEQGSGLRLRFAPGSCISFFTQGFWVEDPSVYRGRGESSISSKIHRILPKMN